MHRRNFLLSGVALAGVAAAGASVFGTRAYSRESSFPVSLTPEEWRERLGPQEFAVLREEATEPPFSSPLNEEKRAGLYHCAGCDNALYSSKTKFDSGTGWPSFYAPLSETAVGTKTDYKIIYPRTEVHCANCGGHLGHIFNDGPPPTGKRHCLNGLALAFVPGATTTS